MTDRPKLYPGHRHQWTDADPQFFHAGMVRCTVCGFQAPRNVAGLDGQMAERDDDIRDRLTADVPGWTIDYEADAAYLQLTRAQIHRTLNFGLVNVDVDTDGLAVGIELLILSPKEPA